MPPGRANRHRSASQVRQTIDTLLDVSPRGFHETTLEDTSQSKLLRAFSRDARGFVARVLREDDEA